MIKYCYTWSFFNIRLSLHYFCIRLEDLDLEKVSEDVEKMAARLKLYSRMGT